MEKIYLFAEETKRVIAEAVALSGCTVPVHEIEVQYQPAPHRPPSGLPTARQAVYAFFYKSTCLKVGKAGPLSAARFTSQHYGPHAPNTLAKSIVGGKDRLLPIVSSEAAGDLQTDDEKLIGQWLKKHASRLNVIIPATAGPHVLSLIEAVLQCRFGPLFERRR
jgi:hypothetical protein